MPAMKTALVLACLAIPTAASAGSYLGVAIGTEPGVNDEFVQSVGQPSGRSLRALVGTRFGNLSLEGGLNGFTVLTNRFGEETAYQLSGALKLSLPLGNNFEAFARGGVERTWLDQPEGFDLSGNGYVVAGGFEFRLDAVLANASLFFDYTLHHAGLESPRFPVDETTRIWAIGITVGI